MKRRSFLRRAAVLPLPLLLGRAPLTALSLPALASAVEGDDRVLVLIRLAGGNDGLNTVLPLDQYAGLMAARPEVVVPEGSALALTDTVGLHPAMGGIRGLFDGGKATIIQGVGYPEQNRSHFRSTDILNTASASDEVLTTGWLGRHFDARYPGFPDAYPSAEEPDPFAIVLGSTTSETCQGRAGNYSMALSNIDNVGSFPVFEGSEDLSLPYGRELDWLRTTISQSNQYAGGVEAAAAAGNNVVEYPAGNPLAGRLRDVARLISGGLQTRLYVVELGGFDTHADQVGGADTTTGAHALLLQQLSDAVAVFQRDLAALGLEERVLGMTYTEFGRRIVANASAGTDHGDAAPVFLFGSCVGGGVTGANVEIPRDIGPGEGVPMQYDFRNVYGSVLMDWFGLDRADVRTLVIEDFDYIPVLNGCRQTTTSTTGAARRQLALSIQPNPARGSATVRFTTANERLRLSIFDTYGRRVRVLADRRFAAGAHELQVTVRDLPAGTYFLHVQQHQGARSTHRLVVQ